MILTHQTLQEHLNKIGYTIKHGYPYRKVFNHKGEDISVRVWADNIEVQGEHDRVKSIFVFDESEIRMIDDCCVCIGSDSAFMNLYNFDKKD